MFTTEIWIVHLAAEGCLRLVGEPDEFGVVCGSDRRLRVPCRAGYGRNCEAPAEEDKCNGNSKDISRAPRCNVHDIIPEVDNTLHYLDWIAKWADKGAADLLPVIAPLSATEHDPGLLNHVARATGLQGSGAYCSSRILPL
jgi:hypothetical protein